MRSLLAQALLVSALALTAGCGLKAGALRGDAKAAAKKDCAACEKMCAVAGDAEGNPDGIAACKADCKKTCTD